MSFIAIPPDPKRARIGLIIPSANRTVEEDLLPAFPADVSAHVTRIRLRGIPPRDLLPAIRHAAGLLADAGCDVVAFHCTATSMEEGVDVARQVQDAVREGAPEAVALSTASALLEALAALSVRRLALLTPYSEAVTVRQRRFLEQAGIEVVSHCAQDLNQYRDYCFLQAPFWQEALVRCMPADAPAALVSCANLPLMQGLVSMEHALARPVLASNQALLWAALRHAGIDAALPALGRLGHMPLAAQHPPVRETVPR